GLRTRGPPRPPRTPMRSSASGPRCVRSAWLPAPNYAASSTGAPRKRAQRRTSLPPSETSTMFPTNAYVIRYATVDDVPALRRLVELHDPRLFCGPALIGEIGGVPAAAVAPAAGRVLPDPSN